MTTVFFDIDTQIDFMFPAGALYVPGAERILPTVSRLNHYAATHSIPLISTVDNHAENDPEFRLYPAHCVHGTAGQQKPQSTLTGSQIFLPKQSVDCFTVRELPALLDRLNAERYVVYGVVTEICVRHAVSGLLRTGKPVCLVTDAIRELDPAAAGEMMREFIRAGGRLSASAEWLG